MQIARISEESIAVPVAPVKQPPAPFPLVASIAPVLASIAIWLITKSPYSLIFAALGPVIAIASLIDNRWSSRRRFRKDTRTYLASLESTSQHISSFHEREREQRLLENPTAKEILADSGTTFSRWRQSAASRTAVVVGRGVVESAVRLEGAVSGEEHLELRRRARTLTAAPCCVDSSNGIGVVGPLALSRAVARGYLVQLCHASGPDALHITALPDDGWDWARRLPHLKLSDPLATPSGVVARDPGVEVRVRIIEPSATGAAQPPFSGVASGQDSRNEVVIVVAESQERVPPRCADVIMLDGFGEATRRSGADASLRQELQLHPVSSTEAAEFARQLDAAAHDIGMAHRDAEPPAHVSYSDVANRENLIGPAAVVADPVSTTLAVPIGMTANGIVDIDLTRSGPHAIVGGTTGSGKSELLVTWALGLVAANPPDRLALLLVDFKGGAAFEPLRVLPNVVGVITDLDPHGVARALESLRAELRYRERKLRDAGFRDVANDDAERLIGRLVIIVDEFAAMLESFPELHALFVDIAARGRSLGMHLILCTQRPAGVVRDALLANCTLRMSLRVNNRADSLAVVGTDSAAALPVTPAGRCIVAVPDAPPIVVQIAHTSTEDLALVAARSEGARTPRRPWLDPLPERLPLAELPASSDALTLGMLDIPSEQRQEPAQWRPDRDGSLLVQGAARRGKSMLCAVLAVQSSSRWRIVRVSTSEEVAWDEVAAAAHEVTGRSSTGGSGRHGSKERHEGTILVIDDLDSLLARLDVDYADRFRQMLAELLRDGPRCGIWIVATVQRLNGLQGVVALFGSSILLGLTSRQEHILAGGETATWLEDRPPGNGIWKGHVVQLALTDSPATLAADESEPELVVGLHETVLVATRNPRPTAARLRQDPSVRVIVLSEHPAGHVRADQVTVASRESSIVIIGDLDAWQTQWSLIGSLRSVATMVVESCSLSDYRAMTRSRELPPLLRREAGRAWRIAADGVVTRCVLPR